MVWPILHPSQIASILGIEHQSSEPAQEVAWDTVSILEGWVKNLNHLSWSEILAPTPSRGRSTRNLTVNAFHPFELLPGAFERGEFPWRPDLTDAEMEASLVDSGSTVEFASNVLNGWKLFLMGQDSEAGFVDGPVTTPRGEVTLHALLDSQRWHAAWHHRQVIDAAKLVGHSLPHRLSDGMSSAIGLPDNVY